MKFAHEKSISVVLVINPRLIATAAHECCIIIWEYPEFKMVLKIDQAHTNSIYGLVKYDKNIIISASYDSSIKAWDIFNNGACVHTFKGHSGSIWRALAVFNEKYFISGDSDSNLIIWDYT